MTSELVEASALMRPEFIDDGVHVSLAGIEARRREILVVRRIRKHARLQADGVALAIGALAFAEEGAVHEVAGIELDAGRRDAHIHHPARTLLFHPRGV